MSINKMTLTISINLTTMWTIIISITRIMITNIRRVVGMKVRSMKIMWTTSMRGTSIIRLMGILMSVTKTRKI
jgi:hypothetical protein